jgi:predicted dinucleotide-binding enzyme
MLRQAASTPASLQDEAISNRYSSALLDLLVISLEVQDLKTTHEELDLYGRIMKYIQRHLSELIAQAFTGARLVKGFNHLVAAVLDQDPAVQGGRRVVFLASDDDSAAEEVAALANNLGFSPLRLGGLSEGGLLVQARGNSWGPLIFKDLVKFD